MGLGNSAGFEFAVQTPGRRAAADLAAVARGAGHRRQQVPGARRRVHDLRRRDAADLSQARPRARRRRWGSPSATSSPRCRPRWAAPTSTTSICSAAPGRSRSRPMQPTARRSTTSSACACAPSNGELRALARRRRCRADHRAGVDHPLQQSALGDDATAGRRPATRRARRSPPWSSSPGRPCRPATAYEWTGTALQEKAASGQTGSILGLARAVRLPVPGRPLRELDDPGRRAAVGRRRPVRRDGWRCS